MLQQVAEPHVILSVRVPLDTYQAIHARALANGVKLSAEARELLARAVRETDQGTEVTK